MSEKLTFPDANVLICAFRGEGVVGANACDVLDDPNRKWVVSDLLRLELIPKAHYNKQVIEEAIYEDFFAAASVFIETTPALMKAAENEAKSFGLGAGDALLIAAAKRAGAIEFITAEKSTKPLFRVTGIKVTSIHA